MNALLNGFETSEATFRTMSSVITKRAVELQNSGDVYYPERGGHFTGIVSSYRDGVASVVMKGYAVAAFKDTIPTVGTCKLIPGSMGNLEVDEENGIPYTVVGVDVASKTFELIL